jgi:ribose transport system permease protein
VALLTGVVLFTYLQRLPAGRKLLAVGANRRAAELTGIQPRLRIFGAFVTTGAICGLGGALYGAQLGSASLSTGSTLMLPAFAGAFLGATAITPGRFNVIGTVVGVLFLAFTVSGLQQMGVSAWAQDVVTGFALVASVALSTWAARIRMARLRKAQLENILGA